MQKILWIQELPKRVTGKTEMFFLLKKIKSYDRNGEADSHDN